MKLFEPDCIIAVGGGSAMDASKIMWVMYEHPEVDFMDMAMRFMDIRKRIYTFPKMGKKLLHLPFLLHQEQVLKLLLSFVITDEESGIKYPLADYELLPKWQLLLMLI